MEERMEGKKGGRGTINVVSIVNITEWGLKGGGHRKRPLGMCMSCHTALWLKKRRSKF